MTDTLGRSILLDASQLESALNLTLDHAEMVLFALDAAGRFRLSTGGGLAALGLAAGEVVGEHISVRFAGNTIHLRLAEALQGSLKGFEEAVGDRVYQTLLQPINMPNQERWVLGVSRDVTAMRGLEQRLAAAETTDLATSLCNRRALLGYLQDRLKRREGLLVVSIGIDNFQRIYGALEYQQIQELIVRVAERLADAAVQAERLARTGSDEFSAVFALTEESDAQRHLDRLHQSMRRAVDLRDFGEVQLTFSIGYTRFTAREGVVEAGRDLLRNAEAAMMAARKAGGDRTVCYSPDAAVAANRALIIENRLRLAIEADALSVHFQPVIDLKTNQVVRAEALVRWTDEELGAVSPAEFVPIAEGARLIDALGRRVLRAAVAEVAAWRCAGLSVTQVAVNCSGAQLERLEFARELDALCREMNVPHDAVELEITEHLLLEPSPTVQRNLDHLVQGGYDVAIDDFGTGYSALGYLTQFHATTIKIDHSFVAQVCQDSGTLSLTRAILQMAESLGMRTVAEGVESAEQLELLRDLGCDFVQGFLYSPGLPPDDFLHWVSQRG